MGTKTLSITEAAYHRLVEEKRPGESFTDVILRLTGRRSLRELTRLVSKEEGEALARAVAAGRETRQQRRKMRLEGGP